MVDDALEHLMLTVEELTHWLPVYPVFNCKKASLLQIKKNLRGSRGSRLVYNLGHTQGLLVYRIFLEG